MSTINYTAPDGSKHSIPLEKGGDAAAVVAQFEAARGFSTPVSVPDTLPDLATDTLPGSIAEANIGRTKAPTFNPVERGLALGGRTVAAAIPRAATGVADLGSMLLNIIPEIIDRLGVASGDKPLDARLPTGSTANLDQFITDVLGVPESETLGEKIVTGGGDLALLGGAGGAALAPKIASVAKNPQLQSRVGLLADDIGQFFAQSPVKAGVIEAGGGAGAVSAGELADELDLGPAGTMGLTVAGGLAGGVAPQSVVNTSRRAATGITNAFDTVASGEVRAARALQDAAADPEAAAKAALDAPQGVLPGRATGQRELRAIEKKVLADDPVRAAAAADDLLEAEQASLKELSEQFGPTTDKAAWQQEVIVRGAPDNATIKIGQPDEMLDDAAKAFKTAYAAAKGFPIAPIVMRVEGGDVPVRELFKSATTNKGIIADKKWRTGIRKFLGGLLEDVTKSAKNGLIDSGKLLDMRATIRAEARRRAKAGQTNPRAAAESEMLNNANRAVTDVLESQLPAEAATALRATDLRYKDFITVQTAVLRSGEKGLTPEALRASVKATAASPGKFARGRTGELGQLAERGKDVAATLGKPDQAARIVRNMTPEQLSGAKADFNKALVDKATPSGAPLKGDSYLKQIEKNRETLKAAGFTDAEIGRMEQIGRELKLIQSRSPEAVTALLEDNLGRAMRLVAAIAGSKSATRVLRFFGSAGAGPSLILARFGSTELTKALKGLSVDKADAMMRAAATDKELYAALLTRPTDTIKKQADAARVIQAWVVEPARQANEAEDKKLRTHDGLPAVKNDDGTLSTEVSITVEDERLNNGKPTNIPSLWGGKIVSDAEAIKKAVASGNSYPSFSSIDSAVTAAKKRSDEK